MECVCPAAGYCETFKRQMPQRLHDICRGAVLSPEKQDAYRKLWAGMRDGTVIRKEKAPEYGPGTELKVILASLGAKADGCAGKCEQLRREMDTWGPDGCESHFPEIVTHLRKAYDEQPLIDKLRAKAAAVTSGLAFQIDDWSDPVPALVRLAISKARANA